MFLALNITGTIGRLILIRWVGDIFSSPSTDAVLAGIRYENTYRGGEITNHMYGIAVDLDHNGLLVPVVRAADTKRLREFVARPSPAG